MPDTLNLPGHVRCTREKYNAEMTRLKSMFGSTLPADWATSLTGEAYEAAYKYANNIYFCEDTSEIFYREICYGFSEASQNAIKALEDAVFTLSYSLSSSANIQKVVGETVTSQTWTWTIKRNGVVVTPTRVTVNGVQQSDVNKLTVTNISSNQTYNIVVYYNTQQVSFSVSIRFYRQRYYGVLATNTGITAADIKTLSKELATSAGLAEKTFNCSGGKYPVIVLPADAGNTVDMNVTVNGLVNTDFSKVSQSLVLDGTTAANYIVIASNGIQYGSALKIKVTN